LQSQLEHRFSHGVQFTASYTWSHSIDDAVDALDRGPGNLVDFRNLQLERGNSSQDIRHRFVFSSVAELPFGRGACGPPTCLAWQKPFWAAGK